MTSDVGYSDVVYNNRVSNRTELNSLKVDRFK
jgi:hypothetical protein